LGEDCTRGSAAGADKEGKEAVGGRLPTLLRQVPREKQSSLIYQPCGGDVMVLKIGSAANRAGAVRGSRTLRMVTEFDVRYGCHFHCVPCLFTGILVCSPRNLSSPSWRSMSPVSCILYTQALLSNRLPQSKKGSFGYHITYWNIMPAEV